MLKSRDAVATRCQVLQINNEFTILLILVKINESTQGIDFVTDFGFNSETSELYIPSLYALSTQPML